METIAVKTSKWFVIRLTGISVVTGQLSMALVMEEDDHSDDNAARASSEYHISPGRLLNGS